MELETAFGIGRILDPKTARETYDKCSEKLKQPECSAHSTVRRYHMGAVYTMDDPADSLEYHVKARGSDFEIKVFPTWHPDKAMAMRVPADFRTYAERLAEVSDVEVFTFGGMIAVLRKHRDLFATQGYKLSDHGIRESHAEGYTGTKIQVIFNKIYGGISLIEGEILKSKSAILIASGEMNWEKD